MRVLGRPHPLSGVTQAFILQLKIAALTGIVLASPIWLYQLWSFITPGLHRHERRYALGFLFAAVPLFLFGVALAIWVLPKGLGILIGFTPEEVDASAYFIGAALLLLLVTSGLSMAWFSRLP